MIYLIATAMLFALAALFLERRYSSSRSEKRRLYRYASVVSFLAFMVLMLPAFGVAKYERLKYLTKVQSHNDNISLLQRTLNAADGDMFLSHAMPFGDRISETKIILSKIGASDDVLRSESVGYNATIISPAWYEEVELDFLEPAVFAHFDKVICSYEIVFKERLDDGSYSERATAIFEDDNDNGFELRNSISYSLRFIPEESQQELCAAGIFYQLGRRR